MAQLVDDCPRCGANRTTFDVRSSNFIGEYHGWKRTYEIFCICRHCDKSTVFKVSMKVDAARKTIFYRDHDPAPLTVSLNGDFMVEGYISPKDRVLTDMPEYLPPDLKAAFEEASVCLSVQCWNASAAMLRLCVDLATKPMLPQDDVEGLSRRTRRDLGLRLPWLFDTKRLPGDLRELAKCIREDGNDGAHDGTLKKEDAEDLLDFTAVLLERIYTEAERLKIAEARRQARRKKEG